MCIVRYEAGTGGRGGFTLLHVRLKLKTWVLASDLADTAFWGLIAVSSTPNQSVLSHFSLPALPPPLPPPLPPLPPWHIQYSSLLLFHSVSKAPGSSVHRCRTAGLHPTGPGCWNGRGKPAHMQNYSASISHTDIIPMFYLSPCNSFYILGLCSLASVQSQPRDTGLYQAHMCALLQLTHISSFVTVTKLARLSWEMCRLWLTAHVWILYFESHADLSNTGSVKASLTLLSSTGTAASCRGSAALTTCLWITLHSL